MGGLRHPMHHYSQNEAPMISPVSKWDKKKEMLWRWFWKRSVQASNLGRSSVVIIYKCNSPRRPYTQQPRWAPLHITKSVPFLLGACFLQSKGMSAPTKPINLMYLIILPKAICIPPPSHLDDSSNFLHEVWFWLQNVLLHMLNRASRTWSTSYLQYSLSGKIKSAW